MNDPQDVPQDSQAPDEGQGASVGRGCIKVTQGASVKRDLDMIRQLLLRIEAQNSVVSSTGLEAICMRFTTPPLCLPGDDPAAIEYNVRQLADAGHLLLTKTQFAGSVNLHGLSWKGHDFLDSVRDEAVWRKTKEGALAAGGFTWDLLCDLAKGLVKKQIETRTGIAL